jgi:hypothetical protein
MRIVAIVAFLSCVAAAAPGCGPAPSAIQEAPQPQAGISQLARARSGRTSCWGIVIRLRDLRFAEIVQPEQIEVTEAKHHGDLRTIMQWRVEQGGRRLVVEFKPGCGDFGSGNQVTVRVARSAILGYEGPDDRFEWSIGTDVQ